MKRPCDYCGKEFPKNGKRQKICDNCWNEVQRASPREKSKIIRKLKNDRF